MISSRSASSHATDVTRGRSITQAAECDHIIVLDRGSIVEEGSHEELLALGGRYADLVGESLICGHRLTAAEPFNRFR
ncbi:hypothetical protein QTN80_01965 [Arachnia propionica]|uniref:hypothetical protein n=1 Tax=Arachnia propionica TaxID=1750 RepID=UPI003990031F